MLIRINRIHYPVTALGPGRRVGIWVQGCSIGCPGCASRDTWEAGAGREVAVESVLRHCRELEGEVDGITISGGEPFEQPEALLALLDALDGWRSESGREIDLLCYSGLPLARLRRDFPAILARLDAVIPEPFVDRLVPEGPWRGSANQPLVALSALGERRYGAAGMAQAAAARPIQVDVQGGQVWFIGIPGRGDLDRLVDACRTRGIVMEGASWRS
ncbi:MAG: 4Fe-4S cluster-binding domain-containing protein [Pseudomonadota bacterium]